MKRIAMIAGIFIVSAQFCAFSQVEKPLIKEARAVLTEFTALVDELTKKIENNKTEKELIDDVDAFIPRFQKSVDTFKAFEKKYPEIKTDPDADAALEGVAEKMVKSLEKFSQTIEKVIEKYPGSEKVKESFLKLTNIIGEFSEE
jgi:hypothetical protein